MRSDPHSIPERAALLRRVRWGIGLVILALVVSGSTAFPLQLELEQFAAFRGLAHASPADLGPGFDRWILTVRDGLRTSYAAYPWLAYGTDWVAFSHLLIAVFFVGAFLDPVRNIWILRAGVLAGALVIPFALIGGAVRHLPLGWRLIDCSFGVFGLIPLYYCLRWTRALEALSSRARQV